MAESLKVVLGADDAQFQEAIKRAIASVDGLAGRTVAFGTAANTTTGNLDKLKGPLRELATSSLRVQGGFGALAEQLLSAFGAGGAVIAGVGAGVLALTFVYNKLTGELRKTREEADSLIASLLKAGSGNATIDNVGSLSAEVARRQQELNAARANAQQTNLAASARSGIIGTTVADPSKVREAQAALEKAQAKLTQLVIEAGRAQAATLAQEYAARTKVTGAIQKQDDALQKLLAGAIYGGAPQLSGVTTTSATNLALPGGTVSGSSATAESLAAEQTANVREAFLAESAALGTDIANGLNAAIGAGIADGIVSGIDAAIKSGSIGAGFKAFTGALLSGLGSAMKQFGKAAILFGIQIDIIKKFLFKNPLTAIAGGVALVAIGSAFEAAGNSIFGGNGGGGGSSGGGFSGSSASVASSVSQQGSVTVVWPKDAFANPSDPTFQDFFAETIRQLGATRQLTIVTA